MQREQNEQWRTAFRDSIGVSISACHADDPGSIPGRGVFVNQASKSCKTLTCAGEKHFQNLKFGHRALAFDWHDHDYIEAMFSSGDLAQMVERSLSMREALGSMPRFSIFSS